MHVFPILYFFDSQDLTSTWVLRWMLPSSCWLVYHHFWRWYFSFIPFPTQVFNSPSWLSSVSQHTNNCKVTEETSRLVFKMLINTKSLGFIRKVESFQKNLHFSILKLIQSSFSVDYHLILWSCIRKNFTAFYTQW